MPLPIPKPPMFDGNPPPYDPKGDLAERCAKAEAELERVTADRDNETKWAKQYHDDWVKVRDELERVQKQAAAMREALGFTLECANELLEYNGESFQFNMRGKMWKLKTQAQAALQPDAGSALRNCTRCKAPYAAIEDDSGMCVKCSLSGSEYIRREDVRPLKDALAMAELYVETEGSDEERSLLCKAFAHAKSLGL